MSKHPHNKHIQKCVDDPAYFAEHYFGLQQLLEGYEKSLFSVVQKMKDKKLVALQGRNHHKPHPKLK